MPFFSQKKTNPLDVVVELKEALTLYLANDSVVETSKKVDRNVAVDRNIRLLQTRLHDPNQTSEVIAQICHELLKHDIVPQLIKSIPLVELDNRKDVVDILTVLTQYKIGAQMATIDYIIARPHITIFELIRLYHNQSSALHIGILLRTFAKYEDLCRLVLFSDLFWEFFSLAESTSFDVSSDSFATFKEFSFKHKSLFVNFLKANYDQFISKLNNLIISDNYVTRRQSLKFLSEIILENANYEYMLKYVSDVENLKRSMNLLLSKSDAIQYEAFHIFKVFVANPNKPQPITQALLRNQAKLVEYFQKFQSGKDSSDEQFLDEKEYVIKCILQLSD